MSIINKQITPTDDRAGRNANQCIMTAQSTYHYMLNMYEEMTKYVWSHQKLTPAEVISGLGTDAGEYLSIIKALETACNNILANSASCSKEQAYTTASDGSVTLD